MSQSPAQRFVRSPVGRVSLLLGVSLWAAVACEAHSADPAKPMRSSVDSASLVALGPSSSATSLGGSMTSPEPQGAYSTPAPSNADRVDSSTRSLSRAPASNQAPRSGGKGAPAKEPSPSAVSASEPAKPSVADGTRALTSASQTGEGYRVYLQVPALTAVGRATQATAHLVALAPFKSNDKYPYRFAVSSHEGLALANTTFSQANVSADSTTLSIPFTPTRRGSARLGGTFSFSVCTPEKCLVERAALDLSFEVTDDASAGGRSP